MQHSSMQHSTPTLPPAGHRRTPVTRAGAFLALTLTLGRHDTLRHVLLWIHGHTVAGCVIFALLYTAFTICFLPPALLAACAGAIYGLLPAMPLVWLCAIVGETVSFLLGRFLLRRWVAELTAGWPMWLALNAALKEDGWKLVGLLRLSPLMPFSIINYALGSSSLPVRPARARCMPAGQQPEQQSGPARLHACAVQARTSVAPLLTPAACPTARPRRVRRAARCPVCALLLAERVWHPAQHVHLHLGRLAGGRRVRGTQRRQRRRAASR